MNKLATLTIIFLVIGVTFSAVEDSVIYGVPLFVLAIFNEGLVAWARRSTPTQPVRTIDEDDYV